MPRCHGMQFFAPLQNSQPTHLVDFGDFELWINNPDPNASDHIADPELLFGVCSRAYSDSKFGISAAKGSTDS